MTDALTVSVVTPCFNAAPHIAATIDSVLSQDYPHIDYLVMDGGSTDGTLDVLRSFGQRVRWISQPDRGQADAINNGFTQTHGEILTWLNADDTYAPGAIQTAATFLAHHPDVDVVYGNANFIDAQGELIGPCAHIESYDEHRLFHYSDFIVQPAAFFRRSAFDAVDGLDASLHWAMDYDLWLKLAGRGTMRHISPVLANYRWLGESKTASGGWKRLAEIRGVLRRHGCGTPAYVRLECVNAHLQDTLAWMKRGEMAGAAGNALCAAGTLLASPRALWSLLSPRTWRIIYMGRVLRAKSEIRSPNPRIKSQ
jgi:glycosyltransferase involved in cell wall biosynthesis